MLFDLDVWEQAWKDRPRSSRYKPKSAPFDTEEAFERWARNYHDQSFTEEGRDRSARIMGWIENQGVTFEGASILDVGAAFWYIYDPICKEKGLRSRQLNHPRRLSR